MRRVVRFLPGSLLLCAAAIALLLLWDGGDARASQPGPDPGQGKLEVAVAFAPPRPATHAEEARLLSLLALPAAPAPLAASAPLAVPAPQTTLSPPEPRSVTAPPTAAASPSISPAGLQQSPAATEGVLAASAETPALPDIPNADAATVTTTVALPPVPIVPPLPDPVPPPPAQPGPLPPDPVGGAAVPDATAFGPSPNLAPAPAPPDPTEYSTLVATDAGGVFADFANRGDPARAPPAQLPVQPCPNGGTPQSDRADLAGVLTPYGGDATRQGRPPADAHSYSSRSLHDPSLRPD